MIFKDIDIFSFFIVPSQYLVKHWLKLIAFVTKVTI